jgi:hypothetical protein
MDAAHAASRIAQCNGQPRELSNRTGSPFFRAFGRRWGKLPATGAARGQIARLSSTRYTVGRTDGARRVIERGKGLEGERFRPFLPSPAITRGDHHGAPILAASPFRPPVLHEQRNGEEGLFRPQE